jgi:hypothetical protein
MQILAFVDTHGSFSAWKKVKALAKKEKPKLLVCAGDISVFGANLDYMVQEINKLNIPCLIIHGNHESEAEMRTACSLFKNTVFIHKKVHEFDKYAFIGYGGGGFSFRDKEFEKVIKNISTKTQIILVLHGPPYGTKLDDIVGSYSGNKSYRKYIEKQQPKLVLCGHIHENEGKIDHIKKSKIINPGPFGKIIRI